MSLLLGIRDGDRASDTGAKVELRKDSSKMTTESSSRDDSVKGLGKRPAEDERYAQFVMKAVLDGARGSVVGVISSF